MSTPTTDPTPPTNPGNESKTSIRELTSRPAANAGWAVASLLFFWPLAFSAFTHAFNVYPAWASGETTTAQYESDRVRELGILSLWIFGGLLVLAAIVYILVAVIMISHGGGHHTRIHHRYR